MTEQDKVTVDDIIGIVKTEEQTNSVEEVLKLRGRGNETAKRYNVWDIDGTIFLEDHKEGSYHIGQVGNVDINCLNDIANRLNDLTEENEQLKCGNKNLKSILNDFINILNRLQSNPNNEQTLNVARDMLQNMGKELEE